MSRRGSYLGGSTLIKIGRLSGTVVGTPQSPIENKSAVSFPKAGGAKIELEKVHRRQTVKKSVVGKMAPPAHKRASKKTKAVKEDSEALQAELARLEKLMSDLLVEIDSPWFSEAKRHAITARFHAVRARYNKLWVKKYSP
jgi:hypothetical protein